MYEKILIVDDSATSRMIIKRCFEIAGYKNSKYFEAEDGLEALTFLEGNQADLIVTDLNMPKMDGQNLIKKLKIKVNSSSIPVVVISSVANEAISNDLIKLGIKGIINKPISPEKINNILGEANGS